MTRAKALLIVVVLAVVAAAGWWFTVGAGKKPAGKVAQRAAASAPVPVTVVSVTQRNVPVYLTANGTVQASEAVNVQPQVAGRLLSVGFKEGQPVAKGAVLAKIDPRTYKAAYDQAVSRMHSDQAQLATAKGQYARSRKLIKKNYVSRQDLEAQKNTVGQLEATVAADRAAVADAKLQLDRTVIRAPISGIAGLQQVDAGNTLTTSDVIVLLTKVQPIDVVFSLPAENLDAVRGRQADHPLSVVAMGRTDSHVLAADGQLDVIDNHIDPASGTFTLKARFPNADTVLWPGQFVTVRLKLDTLNNGLVIPAQAIQRGPDGDYVYVIEQNDTVRMQPVTVGGQAGETQVLIATGLAPGDKVVTEGQFRLKPGTKVKPFAPGEVSLPAAGDPESRDNA